MFQNLTSALPLPARPRAMVAALLLASTLATLLFSVTGCGDIEYRPRAVGPDAEITVVIDSSRWAGPVGEAVRQQLGQRINTLPAPEPAFDLQRRGLLTQRDLDHIQRRKNIVFVAPLSDTTNEASVIQNSMSTEAREAVLSGNSVVAPRKDLWRVDQQIFYVTADTPERLVEAIEDRGQAMRDTFNLLVRERMERDMFERGRQPEIEEHLMEEHGFAVNAQHDYFVAIDTVMANGTGNVWLRRVLQDTWRSLFIHYIEDADPSIITPDWIHRTRDSLAQQWIEGNVGGFPRTDYRRPLETESTDFLGRYGYTTRGLWHMVDVEEDGSLTHYGGGGPYINYTFYDQESGRIYMLDGMVFAPDYDKREFLRQMEVIAHTFRTREEVENGTPVARRSP